ncbi:hypothetical protein AMATHDRAFT_147645 [Amanita thiersii Skay4041]|uniref:Phosphoglycerate mutase-like protein n=1 Tax=Amanita thiersii Skay4041 TaxID=703135 RepID=A0A2A9NJI3_9AGAR|nr:hypothetical protein AMATHDRAFT_147645 [Amanita thiersii Skay4041]
MLTVTFIRHGESEDNLKDIWAGWKDAPLSPLGVKQAEAIGHYFANTNTHFDIIYTSPSARAHSTALAVQQAQVPIHINSHINTTPPPVIPNLNLREQHFGIAEGQPWVLKHPDLVGPNGKALSDKELDVALASLFVRGVFPVVPRPKDKFPGGESLEDLARRAEVAVRECVLPHLRFLKEEGQDYHVAIASHGLCISEIVAALVRLDSEFHPKGEEVGAGVDPGKRFRGLLNTAWARVELNISRTGTDGPIDVADPSINLPRLQVKVTHFNCVEHLAHLVRPISLSIYLIFCDYFSLTNLQQDKEQTEEPKATSSAARKFFSGGGVEASDEKVNLRLQLGLGS